MRSDMAKVIVERPRRGGGARYARGSQPDGPSMELWRRREGMKTAWRDRKTLNENLAPLWRFLRSRIGRPWDKVYSEVCERINKNSAVQLHVWQHLMQEVITDPHKVLGYVRTLRLCGDRASTSIPGRDCCARRIAWPTRAPSTRKPSTVSGLTRRASTAGWMGSGTS